MKSIASIKLSTRCICATILGVSLVSYTVLAQNGNGGNHGNGNGGNNGNGNGGNPNPTPNPNPPPGVNGFGVAIPVPVLNMAQFFTNGPNQDPDATFLNQRIQENFTNALGQLAAAPPGSSKVTQALGKALIYDIKLS